MNQRGNIALYVGLAIVGVILVLGAGVGARYYGQKKASTDLPTTEPPQTSKQKPVETKPIVEDKTKDWKTYRDDELGFEFNYPQELGKVIEKPGIRSTGLEINFEGAGEATLKYGIPGSISSFIYDKAISFSNSPLSSGFTILKLNPPTGRLSDVINLLDDKANLEKEFSLVNSNGIKIRAYPMGFSSIETDITTFYKFYGDSLEVEGSMGYAPYYGTPEEIELREYDCNNDKKFGKDPVPGKDCGIVLWVKGGKTSDKIRNAFSTFQQVVDSFKFIKS